jgi:hypothetical protein
METTTNTQPATTASRSYGRQASGKTIRSVSLEADTAAWLEQTAAGENRSASKFVNELLRKKKDAA